MLHLNSFSILILSCSRFALHQNWNYPDYLRYSYILLKRIIFLHRQNTMNCLHVSKNDWSKFEKDIYHLRRSSCIMRFQAQVRDHKFFGYCVFSHMQKKVEDRYPLNGVPNMGGFHQRYERHKYRPVVRSYHRSSAVVFWTFYGVILVLRTHIGIELTFSRPMLGSIMLAGQTLRAVATVAVVAVVAMVASPQSLTVRFPRDFRTGS